MRVKILDAWCCGLPVVSTSLGAEGIRAIDGENILLADDARSFAESVIRVMQDRTLARRLAANGRSAAEDSYDWKKVYRAWDEIYH
jgi:glycosyltransferase involved in cell wall biosynthesis